MKAGKATGSRPRDSRVYCLSPWLVRGTLENLTSALLMGVSILTSEDESG